MPCTTITINDTGVEKPPEEDRGLVIPVFLILAIAIAILIKR